MVGPHLRLQAERAIEAVRSWKFDPARKNDVPVAVMVNVEVNFRLY